MVKRTAAASIALAIAVLGCEHTEEDGDVSAPSNVSCDNSAACLVKVAWDWEDANASGAVQFKIERRLGEGPWLAVASVTADAGDGSYAWVDSAKADRALAVDVPYTYRVRAVASGERVSPWSDGALAIFKAPDPDAIVGGTSMGCGDI